MWRDKSAKKVRSNEENYRKVYGENAIRVVRQEIRPGILGKDGKKLEVMEGQEAGKKRDDENNPGRGRRNRRKIGSLRMDRGR